MTDPLPEQGPDAGAATATAAPDRNRWVALAVCCSALFMTLLDVSVTNVALPSIGRATDAGNSSLQWIVSGYTLAFGLVPVLAGRLGDDHGRRVMFQTGVAGFVVTSALSGLAPTTGVLIVARVLQGLSGGLINPQVSGLVQQMFRGNERGKAFGTIGTMVGTATALGPVIGGALIALGGPHLGWRLVFFVNVPVGIVVLGLARRFLPTSGRHGQHRLDIGGALLLGTATFCVLFAAVEYDALRDLRLLWLVVPALVLLELFRRREARLTRERRDPLVDLRLFRVPSYTAGVVLALTYFPAQAGLPLVLAIYYQRGLGYSALESGLGVTAFAVGSALSARSRWVWSRCSSPPSRRCRRRCCWRVRCS
jgi:MFS family permease